MNVSAYKRAKAFLNAQRRIMDKNLETSGNGVVCYDAVVQTLAGHK